MTTRATKIRSAVAVLAVLGWFALVLQYVLILRTGAGMILSTGETTIRFFSYFTIQANIFASMALTAFAVRSAAAEWLIHPFVRSAVAVYIAMVGIVYTVLLRELWSPVGAQWLADTLLHDVMPVGYLAFWFACVRKTGLRWYDPLLWTIYPLFYLGFILVRGRFSGFYPYPFLDAGSLGYAQVAANTALLLVGCILLGGLLLMAGRPLARRQQA